MLNLKKDSKPVKKAGFTLAELLIVVAIIAVLTAIAIPVFTSQLEKSREAVDISTLRSYYAEIAAAVNSGELKDVGDSITVGDGLQAKMDGYYNGRNYYLVKLEGMEFKQTQEDWQTADFTIAGVPKSKVMEWIPDIKTVQYDYRIEDDGDLTLIAIEWKT